VDTATADMAVDAGVDTATVDVSVDAATVDVPVVPDGVESDPGQPDAGPDINVGQVAASCGSADQGLTPVDCTVDGDAEAYCVYGNHCGCSEGFSCSSTPATGAGECPPGDHCVVVTGQPVPAACPSGGEGALGPMLEIPGTVQGFAGEDGTPVDGATITVLFEGGCRTATSDVDGTFTIEVPAVSPFAVLGEAAEHEGAFTLYADGLDALTFGGFIDPTLPVALRPESTNAAFEQLYGFSLDPTKGSVTVNFNLQGAPPEGFGMELTPASGVAYRNTPEGTLEPGNMLRPDNLVHVVAYYNVEPGLPAVTTLAPAGYACTLLYDGQWLVWANVATRATVTCAPTN